MNRYEMLYILVADQTEELREASINKFADIVTKDGGKVEKIDKQGIKKLAYAIDYKTEGFYVLMTFEANPSLIKELERVAGISDEIIRRMITRL